MKKARSRAEFDAMTFDEVVADITDSLADYTGLGIALTRKQAATLLDGIKALRPEAVGSDVQRQDMTRLEWLSELLQHCPHAELKYNDDEDEGPVGWSLVIESCTRMDLKAPTLEALIDLGMGTEPDEDGNVEAQSTLSPLAHKEKT